MFLGRPNSRVLENSGPLLANMRYIWVNGRHLAARMWGAAYVSCAQEGSPWLCPHQRPA